MSPARQNEQNPADIDPKRKDPHTPVRLRLLTTFFQLFKESCPKVPDEYFNLLQYIFMQHIKSVWEEAAWILQDKKDTRLDLTTAADYLQACLDIRRPDPVVCKYPFIFWSILKFYVL